MMFLTSEIQFFESALDTLPEKQAVVMKEMIAGDITWNAMCLIHRISRTTLAKYRRHAIARLSEIYDQNDRESVDYMLS